MYRSSSKTFSNAWTKLMNSADQQLKPDMKPAQDPAKIVEDDSKPVRNRGVNAGISAAIPRDQGECAEKNFLDRPNLQEAILWSEILGKPVSKRRKRRYYGN